MGRSSFRSGTRFSREALAGPTVKWLDGDPAAGAGCAAPGTGGRKRSLLRLVWTNRGRDRSPAGPQRGGRARAGAPPGCARRGNERVLPRPRRQPARTHLVRLKQVHRYLFALQNNTFGLLVSKTLFTEKR